MLYEVSFLSYISYLCYIFYHIFNIYLYVYYMFVFVIYSYFHIIGFQICVITFSFSLYAQNCFKGTHREKAPSNKTLALTKSINMDI